MPSANWYFKDAVEARNNLTRKQEREIRKVYNEWAREARDTAKALTRSGQKEEARKATELYYQMKEASKRITAEINKDITRNVNEMSDVTVRTNKRWLKSVGLTDEIINKKFSRAKDIAVRSILSGNLYKTDKPLSENVWKITESNVKDIYSIVSKGIAEGKSVNDIAYQLEKYLNTSKNLGWKASTVTTSTGSKRIITVNNNKPDWRAQRLARTMVQHSYQQTLVGLTKDNPFVLGYMWHANGGRPCEICEERDGMFFTASSLPLDHPNGMCDFEVVVDEEAAANNMKEFYENPIYYPDIDRYTD